VFGAGGSTNEGNPDGNQTEKGYQRDETSPGSAETLDESDDDRIQEQMSKNVG
jgi:hypothetical protein